MPEYLFFRPPRRQPRILAITTEVNKLAMVSLDPWELRTIAEHSISLKPAERLDKCHALIRETIVRERPQALVVLASRSTARVVAKQFGKHYGLPVVEISPYDWQKCFKQEPKIQLETFFKALPERHLSSRLFQNKRLRKTALVAHVALTRLLKQSYDAQPTIEIRE